MVVTMNNNVQQVNDSPAPASAIFVIGRKELGKRNRNLLWGLLLSLFLAAVTVIENHEDPATYNDVLMWSILGFLALANIVNYFRHLRYARLVRTHNVQLEGGKIVFHTADDVSELDVSAIAIMHQYTSSGRLQHIQLRLKNNRGIRLEGYDRLEEMAGMISAQLQPHQVMERKSLFG